MRERTSHERVGTMQIDGTTLSDLEIFGTADGSGGLFQLIDRTATSRGRAALRRRLEAPSEDCETIRRTQDAVRFLRLHPRIFPLTDPALESVASYVRSNIVLRTSWPLAARVEQAWMALRYRDLLGELDVGAQNTVTLFTYVAQVSRSIATGGAPPLLLEAAQRLQETAEMVLRARAEATSLLGIDRLLRGRCRERIEQALDLLGEIDALSAMADATESLGWTMPELVEADTFSLDAEGVFHPFLSHAVPNPARLSGGQPMVFLTGPNMAGKTTYLRAVALVVLLGQVGMGVPATRARFTPVQALFTSLNPVDNLRAGLSYFLAEVMRVKAAAHLLAAGSRALILFDEVFKGTNVRDALDASAEVILGFAKARRSGLMFSSHLAELAGVLRSNPAIRFHYFDGDLVQDTPRYTYQLHDGVSDKRLGLVLLRQAGVPELIEQIGT